MLLGGDEERDWDTELGVRREGGVHCDGYSSGVIPHLTHIKQTRKPSRAQTWQGVEETFFWR